MNRALKILIIICIFIGIVIFSFYSVNNGINYSLKDYSCKEIEKSIVEGSCLLRFRYYYAGGICFNAEEKFVYYTLFCKDKKDGVIRLNG